MADDGYEVKRGIIRKPKVAYKCTKCHNDLESDLTDAGKKDTCPLCKAAFIVPGQRELNEIQDAAKQAEAEKTRKDEEHRARVTDRAPVSVASMKRWSIGLGIGRAVGYGIHWLKRRNVQVNRWKALLAGVVALFLLVVIVGLFQSKSTPLGPGVTTPGEYTDEQRAADWDREHAKQREEDDKKAALARAEGARQKAEAEKHFRETLSVMDAAERLKIVNAKDEKGCTLLHKAIIANDTAFVEELLGYGADIRIFADDGSLPIHLAAESGNPEIVRLLLARGADPNANMTLRLTGRYVENEVVHTEGRFVQLDKTPLFVAVEKGKKELILLLIAKGAQVNAVMKDSFGETPLIWALTFGNVEAATVLIEAGAQVNARWNDRETPLHLAATSGSKELILLLIAKGAQVNAIDNMGNTPLDYAWGTEGAEEILRKNGAVSGH